MSPSKLSRRHLLGTTAATLAAAGAGVFEPAEAAQQRGTATPPAASTGEPELRLVNGKIHTMDGRNTVVDAVSIKNGTFAAVGRLPAALPGARTINLQGRTVIPGIVDAHTHTVSLAIRPGYHTMLENTASIKEIQETLAVRRTSVPDGQWITSM